jgi:Ca-activated chloride channel family protein
VSFARPLLLLGLLALPLWWWLRARRLVRLPGTTLSDLRPLGAPGERQWVARLPVNLRSLCLGAWIFAAAGPRIGSARSEVHSEGISIILAIDISSSMLAQDFTPANRIDVAKQTAIDFIRARSNDRIGLVIFAAQALTKVPITTDYAVLEQAVQDVHIGEVEDGTAIGTAIATAANRLRRSPGQSRVLVLLTDGVNNRGTVDPRTAAQAAAAFGVRIYAIGVGTRGEAPVPTGQGIDGQLRYQSMQVEIDEQLLTDVAAMTGGRYFRATDSESLRHIFDEINRLVKTTVQQVVYRRFDEAYRWPLGLGLLALAFEIVVSATLAVRVP